MSKTFWGSWNRGCLQDLRLPEESQDLGLKICLREDFCLWDAFIYPSSTGFHPSAPPGWVQAPTDWTWTDLGRCHLLWTTVCSSTSGLCFPVSRLSRCRWPKLSLSIFSFLQMVRTDTARCVWAADCPGTGHVPSATNGGSSFHPSPSVLPTQSGRRVCPSVPHTPRSVNPRGDNQVTLQLLKLRQHITCWYFPSWRSWWAVPGQKPTINKMPGLTWLSPKKYLL